MDSAVGLQASPWRGCPIRTSADHSLLAAPRGLSQPSTSFIGSWCQGIHRAPLLARRLDLSNPPSRQDQCSQKDLIHSSIVGHSFAPSCVRAHAPYPFRRSPRTGKRAPRSRASDIYCLLNYSSVLQVRTQKTARRPSSHQQARQRGSCLRDYAVGRLHCTDDLLLPRRLLVLCVTALRAQPCSRPSEKSLYQLASVGCKRFVGV